MRAQRVEGPLRRQRVDCTACKTVVTFALARFCSSGEHVRHLSLMRQDHSQSSETRFEAVFSECSVKVDEIIIFAPYESPMEI